MAASIKQTKRVNFSSNKFPIEYPDFLDIQLKSFQDFFQLETTPENRKKEGLFKELVLDDSIKNGKSRKIGLNTKRYFVFQNYPYMQSTVGYYVKDVVPVLENMGLKVKYDGVGKIIEQSIPSGHKIAKGSIIYIKAK